MLTDVKYEGVDNFSDLIGTLVTCSNSTLASIRALELQNRTNCQFILKSLNYCNQNTHQEVEGTLTLASREKREAEGECTSKCCSRPMKVNIRFLTKEFSHASGETKTFFRKLEGFSFIFQPEEFDASHCRGRCPPRYHPLNDHSLLQVPDIQPFSFLPFFAGLPFNLVDIF